MIKLHPVCKNCLRSGFLNWCLVIKLVQHSSHCQVYMISNKNMNQNLNE